MDRTNCTVSSQLVMNPPFYSSDVLGIKVDEHDTLVRPCSGRHPAKGLVR